MRYFSSPGSPPAAIDSRQDTPKGGLPHSEISGSPGARPSPELFAACHVLHRLSVPRHPPDALVVLAHAQPQGRACARPDVRCQRSDGSGPTRPACCCIIPDRCLKPCVGLPLPGQRAPAYLHTHARARPSRRTRPEGPGGCSCHARFTVTTRFTMSKTPQRPTPPLRGTTRADLLSGAPDAGGVPPGRNPRLLVGLGRFERPTSRLSGVRSNQLSYRPGFRCQRTDVRDVRRHRARRTGAPALAPQGPLTVCDPLSDICPLSSDIWKGCAGGGRGFGDAAGGRALRPSPAGPA